MNEQNIPIDIHSNKLLDWLVSRRHVNKDWQKSITPIREKINNAIQDMPAHEGIVKLLTGQHINYFHCLKIIDILKETEADTKNLFGRYGSQRMKDWQDILSSYEKENIYLAEASQILIRNVKFEIPSLRKQIVKLQQSQSDCEKKIKERAKSESITLKEFKLECEQLGIKGKNIKEELLELIKDLPIIYEDVANDIKEINDAVLLYEAFYELHFNSKSNLLESLKYVIKKGNTTTYEYINGVAPPVIQKLPSEPSHNSDNTSSNEIDFGDDIDFGTEKIDYDVNEVIDYDVTSFSDDNIDWSVKTEEDFEIVDHKDVEKQHKNSSGSDPAEIDSTSYLTLLDNPETRANILNDLLELSSFLKMRLYEMSNENNLLFMSQLQDSSSVIQKQTSESITEVQKKVSKAITGLTNKRIQYLHNIKHSSNYIDTITSNLNQKLLLIDRVKTGNALLEEKIVDINLEIKNLERLVHILVGKTKELQSEIEREISKKYSGRVVNIIGGVNIL